MKLLVMSRVNVGDEYELHGYEVIEKELFDKSLQEMKDDLTETIEFYHGNDVISIDDYDLGPNGFFKIQEITEGFHNQLKEYGIETFGNDMFWNVYETIMCRND